MSACRYWTSERCADVQARFPAAWAELEDCLFGSYDARIKALEAENAALRKRIAGRGVAARAGGEVE